MTGVQSLQYKYPRVMFLLWRCTLLSWRKMETLLLCFIVVNDIVDGFNVIVIVGLFDEKQRPHF